ncbi:hypothetical protein [Calothrix sp. UHCC 0171]|uniref:hypothetical protein n=1 Tax=Calothrix sp. UHCC 0171 TaxID=3110245 RepID=UPI002B1ED9EA|nr:hypothetical protein [Calothrix sp. UHCC 0171]MEA5573707.1 hypothetical protein [Calothrix sp. UHCC 0171]
MKNMEEEEQNLQLDIKNLSEMSLEPKRIIIENKKSNYIPMRNYPIVQSVGYSGWQVFDIWRDIRVDNFSDF